VSLNVRLLFLINVVTLLVVTAWVSAVIAVLLRRRFDRRLQENRMATIGTTTASILHQVKNPVQTLLLQAELLEEFERTGQDELRREASNAIFGEALRLSTLLNELSGWTAGARRPLCPVSIPLHDLLDQVARQEQPEATRLGIMLEVRILSEAVAAVDAYYFRQALENLVRNAREALAGQSDGVIRLELERMGTNAAVRVIDNGPGIERERLSTIFEPFVTTKSSGMGLGLVICKEIVEKHGGRLEVRSAPGVGTTFIINVPVEAEMRLPKSDREI
jgi:signal transduction histidine kinase